MIGEEWNEKYMEGGGGQLISTVCYESPALIVHSYKNSIFFFWWRVQIR